MKLSRSAKLRKYAVVYKSYKRKSQQSKINKSPRRPRNKPADKPETKSKRKPPKSKRKPLNPYQKFVQSESKKEKYNKLPGKQRLRAIAIEWKQK